MANVTYLIGAGASAGKRDDNGNIIEGLPCVNEITKCLHDIVDLLEHTKLPEEIDWLKPTIGLKNRQDWQNAQDLILSLFRHLLEKSSEHATIDTYAKKLRLKGEIEELRLLEQLLSLFFMYLQMDSKPDSRYDSFLASILQMDMHFPDNICVLSWNYDSQIEVAYSEYNNGENLITASKKNNIVPPCVEVIKINGTASFEGQSYFPKERKRYQEALQKMKYFRDGDFGQEVNPARNQRRMMQLIFLYQLYMAGKQDNTNLSFAFDDYLPTEAMFNRIDSIMEKTDVLVIIGYTFPFFNREIDRRILQKFRPQARIYIQDKYPNRIIQSFKAVKSNIPEGHFELKDETDQFFLPPEL